MKIKDYPTKTMLTVSNWNRFEGLCIAGAYQLDQPLEESGNAAFFRAFFGPERQMVVLKLIPVEAMSPDSQLELWRRISHLRHPNLLRLFDYGRGELAGECFLYAAFEYPEEVLANAGPLTQRESDDVLHAAIQCLRYLHTQGFVHTAIDRAHIVAVGNQIKLSSDTLHPPSGPASMADDIKSLVNLASELGSRWTATQISQALDPPQTPRASPEIRRPRLQKWHYAAILGVFLILGFLLFPRAPTPSPPLPRPASAPVQQPASARPVTPLPARQSASEQLPSASSPPRTPRPYWRLIAYTYSVRRLAELKSQSINKEWPQAHAEVFSPDNPARPPFLVALGGRMTREEALRLLRIARNKHLPRDSYIQNYSR